MKSFLSQSFWQNHLDRVASWALTSLPSMIVILILGWVLMRSLNPILSKLASMFMGRLRSNGDSNGEAEKRIETLFQILRSVLRVLVGFVVTLLLLRQIGVDIAPLIAGAGIVGLAVGFGAQNLVRDVISGFFILLEDQIRVGDVAEINGTGGLVESVGLRTVSLRDLGGVVHIFQNGSITMISNRTKDWSAYVFDIGVAYDSDIDHVIATIRAVGEDMRQDPMMSPWILEPLEMLGVDRFEDNAIVVRARFKTIPLKQWDVGREYNRRLKKKFDAEGIEIPFPQRTFHLASPLSSLLGKKMTTPE